MSYRRPTPRKLDIQEFEILNLDTGKTVAHAYDKYEAEEMAIAYRANPSLAFVGIDRSGYEARTWMLDQVLQGALLRECL